MPIVKIEQMKPSSNIPAIPALYPANRRTLGLVLLAYFIFSGSGSPPGIFPAEEWIISLGAENTWNAAERRSGITEMNAVRPWPVLVLESTLQTTRESGEVPDLALSFDEGSPEHYSGGSRYSVSTNPGNGGARVSVVGPEWARMGAGAAFFSAHAATPPGNGSAGPLLITASDSGALFAPRAHIRDFSLEFWLYPLNLENGEQILNWSASLFGTALSSSSQRILCSVVRNRLRWDFSGFFISPGGQEELNITLDGEKPVIPKTWSHHLIRFDADTGLVEYLVNGRVEALAYTVRDGREGGEVYTPSTGIGGEFVLGRIYTGMMDEFRIHRRYAGQTGREFGLEGGLQKYPPGGGRVETRTLDLGPGAAQVLRLETLGGRIGPEGARLRNDYAGSGDLRFSDDSAIQFFMRFGDNPYHWTGEDWQVIQPWLDLPGEFRGRYVQVAAVFYPGAGGESSPYLEELRVVYRPDEPPRPPVRLNAVARDGAVDLSWVQSTAEVDGYLVYYGTAPGEYFGLVALRGASPIDAGKHGTLRIEGLKNGTLYYFAVAAYRRVNQDGNPGAPGLLIGEYSQEMTARPLLGYTLGRYE
jgi:hypothetical protein